MPGKEPKLQKLVQNCTEVQSQIKLNLQDSEDDVDLLFTVGGVT